MIYDAERGVRIRREVLPAIEDINRSSIKGIACKTQGAHLITCTSKLSVISVLQRTSCHSPNSPRSIQPKKKKKTPNSPLSPASGHVNPFPVIATELVSRGHEVRWLCSPRFRARLSATGAHIIPWSSSICDADITPGKPDAGNRVAAWWRQCP